MGGSLKISASGIQDLPHLILPTDLLKTVFAKLRNCHYSPENDNKVEISSRKFEVRLNSYMALAAITATEQSVYGLILHYKLLQHRRVPIIKNKDCSLSQKSQILLWLCSSL